MHLNSFGWNHRILLHVTRPYFGSGYETSTDRQTDRQTDTHVHTHTHKVDYKEVNTLTNKYLVSVSAMLNKSIIAQDSSHYQ